MAKPVIHISDVEAASNFAGLLAQVRAGAEVIIEHDAQPIAVLHPASPKLDWSKCAQVEIDPLRVGGRPVIKDTRMPVEDIISNYEYGVSVEEISEQFGIETETIYDVLNYAERYHTLARPLPTPDGVVSVIPPIRAGVSRPSEIQVHVATLRK